MPSPFLSSDASGGTVSLHTQSAEKETRGSDDACSTSKSGGAGKRSHRTGLSLFITHQFMPSIPASTARALIFLSSEAGTNLRSPVLSSDTSPCNSTGSSSQEDLSIRKQILLFYRCVVSFQQLYSEYATAEERFQWTIASPLLLPETRLCSLDANSESFFCGAVLRDTKQCRSEYWKAACGESRLSGLDGGKNVSSYLSVLLIKLHVLSHDTSDSSSCSLVQERDQTCQQDTLCPTHSRTPLMRNSAWCIRNSAQVTKILQISAQSCWDCFPL